MALITLLTCLNETIPDEKKMEVALSTCRINGTLKVEFVSDPISRNLTDFIIAPYDLKMYNVKGGCCQLDTRIQRRFLSFLGRSIIWVAKRFLEWLAYDVFSIIKDIIKGDKKEESKGIIKGDKKEERGHERDQTNQYDPNKKERDQQKDDIITFNVRSVRTSAKKSSATCPRAAALSSSIRSNRDEWRFVFKFNF